MKILRYVFYSSGIHYYRQFKQECKCLFFLIIILFEHRIKFGAILYQFKALGCKTYT